MVRLRRGGLPPMDVQGQCLVHAAFGALAHARARGLVSIVAHLGWRNLPMPRDRAGVALHGARIAPALDRVPIGSATDTSFRDSMQASAECLPDSREMRTAKD